MPVLGHDLADQNLPLRSKMIRQDPAWQMAKATTKVEEDDSDSEIADVDDL